MGKEWEVVGTQLPHPSLTCVILCNGITKSTLRKADFPPCLSSSNSPIHSLPAPPPPSSNSHQLMAAEASPPYFPATPRAPINEVVV